MIHQYRKKSVVIEAMQFQRRNNGPVPYPEWFDDAVTRNDIITHNTGKWHDPTQPAYCEIITLEGIMRANEGDWIIRGVKGELYPCKPDIFAATYEDVAARELDVEAERREFEARMGPQGDDPTPAWWYHLHAAAEALADHGCEANASDVRDIANNLLDRAAPVSTEQAGDAKRVTWWLAEVDQYDNAKLVDGQHGDRSGADKAAFLFNSLGLTGDRKLAVAKVELSEPRPSSAGVNMEAVQQCNRARVSIAPSPNNSPVGADKEPK